ncbi:MAG: homoserine kinase [Acidobacteria bacterium]|nr:MAG: homoserine kinase [Acidobacteriota bacterium]
MGGGARNAVRAFAPATVGNVACGVDVFGFAVAGLGDEVLLRRAGGPPGLTITAVRGDGGALPRAVEENAASVAAQAVAEAAGGLPSAVELELVKGLPLASGLGSSAASAVAGAVAMDALLGAGLDRRTLLACAVAGERVACGSAHADNAAPALYGGFVLVRPAEGRVEALPVPRRLYCALLLPSARLETGRARAVLPAAVPFDEAVRQWGNAAALVLALCRGDFELLASALHDAVAEPRRAALIPGLRRVQAAAKAAGALGSSISGAGPAIFALCDGRERAGEVARAMRDAFTRATGKEARSHLSPAGAAGARLLDPAGEGEAPCAT